MSTTNEHDRPLPSQPVRRALFDVLEARASNLAEDRALFNPSPGCDSHAERLAGLHRYGVPDDVIRSLLADVRHIRELNQIEGESEMSAAGRLDGLAAATRHAELNERAGHVLSRKTIATQLRDLFNVLWTDRDDRDVIELVRAFCALKRIIDHNPRDQVLSPTVANQLGELQYDRLRELVKAWS